MAIPVTLEDAKRQLRVELDDDERDEEIVGFINDAVAWVEEWTGHIFVARDITAEFASFKDISFREWPIAPGAAPTVTYPDGGSAVTVTDVRAITSRRPVRILPWIGSRWPTVSVGTGATATVRAGYEDSDTVPGVFRRVMLILIAAYDDDREGGAAFQKAEETARALCRGLRPRAV
jgi:uncharacterized phiE125 gp8 family phage protein